MTTHIRPRDIAPQAVMSYEAALADSKRIVDRLGTHIDPMILPLVATLRMCGIPTCASCEGHMDHGERYPWVNVELGQEGVLNRLIAWQNRPTGNDGKPNRNTWVLEPSPHGWFLIPQKLDLDLPTLQRYAIEFAERINHMLEAVENGKKYRTC